jgi:hypothetical protein
MHGRHGVGKMHCDSPTAVAAANKANTVTLYRKGKLGLWGDKYAHITDESEEMEDVQHQADLRPDSSEETRVQRAARLRGPARAASSPITSQGARRAPRDR